MSQQASAKPRPPQPPAPTKPTPPAKDILAHTHPSDGPAAPAKPSWPHPAASSAKAPAKPAAPPPPARVSKHEQKTVATYIDAVTKHTYGSGSSYFKIQTSEGEKFSTFSQTIADTASKFAESGQQAQMVLEMQPKGPVVQSIQPIG